jgi:hypothetical protein
MWVGSAVGLAGLFLSMIPWAIIGLMEWLQPS